MAMLERLERRLRRHADKRNRREIQDRLRFPNSPQAISSGLFLTTHKCASSFVSKLLRELTRGSELMHVDYADAAWRIHDELDESASIGDYVEAHDRHLFRAYGELYGPIRASIDFPGIDGFPKFFFLRDPRDVLVSWYFSTRESHDPPPTPRSRERFLAERKAVLEQSIDDFVIRYAEQRLTKTLATYRALRERTVAAEVALYDDYAASPDAFIRRVEKFFGLKASDARLQELSAAASPVQKDTDHTRHQRSGRSGQYKELLRPDTVARLNELFATDLEFWGFDQRPSAAGGG